MDSDKDDEMESPDLSEDEKLFIAERPTAGSRDEGSTSKQKSNRDKSPETPEMDELLDLLSDRVKEEKVDSSYEKYEQGLSSSTQSRSNPGSDEDEDDSSDIPSNLIQQDDNLIVIHMDIREPLSTLRSLIEEKLGHKLDDFKITLQNNSYLNENSTLVDLCIQGEGIVQINCDLKVSHNTGNRIDIVDVVKPAEEYFESYETEDNESEKQNGSSDKDPKTRWIVDSEFKKYQQKNGIPLDPGKWTAEHVRHWLMWAVDKFSLSGIDLEQWNLTGAELEKMTWHQFQSRVPRDPYKSFWTHFELVRKCKIVAANPGRAEYRRMDCQSEDDVVVKVENEDDDDPKEGPSTSTEEEAQPTIDFELMESEAANDNQGPSGLGNVQLWQFLLELLTNWTHRGAIQWVGKSGEFKLVDPELVAQMWGVRKNKPAMNYAKLSRALRYYYEGDMIAKVPGERYVYKFVCDLKTLIGMDAEQLNKEVMDAENRFSNADLDEVVEVDESVPKLPNTIHLNKFITLVP